MQVNPCVYANSLEVCSTAENPVHSAMGGIRNLWLSTLTWCFFGWDGRKVFLLFVFTYWWHQNVTSHKTGNDNNGLRSVSCRKGFCHAPDSCQHSIYSAFCPGTLPVVFSALLFVFNCDAAQLPLLQLPSPLPLRQVFGGQSNRISYGKEEGKVCVVCSSVALLCFKEKDLRHWDSKRLLTPPVNSLYI